MDVSLEAGSFDLVIAMFPALLRTPERAAEHRLLDLVAPDDVRSVAENAGGWGPMTATRRPSGVGSGVNLHHKDEWVVRLQRI